MIVAVLLLFWRFSQGELRFFRRFSGTLKQAGSPYLALSIPV